MGDFSIASLSSALRDWMWYVLKGDFHPLMPSYVLDTITFIQEHVEESYHRGWKIIPLVKDEERDRRIRFIDSSFKREFTQETGTILLLCEVPEGCRIVDSGRTILDQGGKFLSTATRCHLSTGVYDSAWYECVDSHAPSYDLHSDFEFYGALLVHRTASGVEVLDSDLLLSFSEDPERNQEIGNLFSHVQSYSSGFRTPAHWITAVVTVPSDFGWSKEARISIDPVPLWQVQFD